MNIPREDIQRTLEWALGGNNIVRTYAKSFMTESNAMHWNRELRMYMGEYSAKLVGGVLSQPQLFVATGGISISRTISSTRSG